VRHLWEVSLVGGEAQRSPFSHIEDDIALRDVDRADEEGVRRRGNNHSTGGTPASFKCADERVRVQSLPISFSAVVHYVAHALLGNHKRDSRGQKEKGKERGQRPAHKSIFAPLSQQNNTCCSLHHLDKYEAKFIVRYL
jgi:hypothetical protein